GEGAMATSASSGGPRGAANSRRSRPVVRSHCKKRLAQQENRDLPSGANRSEWNSPVCPVGGSISLPVVTSQRWATLSDPVEANDLPSGENAKERIQKGPCHRRSSLHVSESHKRIS